MSIDWKHTTKNFVLAAGTWLAITVASVMLYQTFPEGISLALASIAVGVVLTLVGLKISVLSKRIILPVSGIGLSAALSAIPSEAGLGHLDGLAVVISVAGIIGCVCTLFYFALND